MAAGYDYPDVAPTSGAFVGTCPGVLATRKRLTTLPRRLLYLAMGVDRQASP